MMSPEVEIEIMKIAKITDSYIMLSADQNTDNKLLLAEAGLRDVSKLAKKLLQERGHDENTIS